jgi:hypothetical protein
MGIDRESNRLKVKSDGHESKELYDLKVVKLSKKGPEVFSHNDIALDAGAAWMVDYSSWEGEGHAMSISIDENDDGTVDETLGLADEGGSYGEVTDDDNQMAEVEVDEGDASQDQEVLSTNSESIDTNDELIDTNIDTESGAETVFDGSPDAGGDSGSD